MKCTCNFGAGRSNKHLSLPFHNRHVDPNPAGDVLGTSELHCGSSSPLNSLSQCSTDISLISPICPAHLHHNQSSSPSGPYRRLGWYRLIRKVARLRTRPELSQSYRYPQPSRALSYLSTSEHDIISKANFHSRALKAELQVVWFLSFVKAYLYTRVACPASTARPPRFVHAIAWSSPTRISTSASYLELYLTSSRALN